jgi:pimeloyl-ACP methyl ester carboxylesterase
MALPPFWHYLAAMNRVEESVVSANGVEITAMTAGEGPLALCLHGFPDSAHTRRHLVPALAAGYRAAAPFQRGDAPTSVPSDSGHFPHVERPDVVNARILDFPA